MKFEVEPVVDCVEKLAGLVGVDTLAGNDYDWASIEANLGLTLPQDYKAVLERFPSGYFQGAVRLIRPGDHKESPTDFLGYYAHRLGDLRDWRSRSPQSVPSPLYPEPGGLLPWGVTRTAALVFWLADPANEPEKWPVMVADLEFESWQRFDGTMCQFLVELVSGEFDYSRFGVKVAGGAPMLELPPPPKPKQAPRPPSAHFWQARNLMGTVPKSRLADLLSLTGIEPLTVPTVPWASVEAQLGVPLPSDYKAFVDRYGSGTFCDITIAAPLGRHDLADLLRRKAGVAAACALPAGIRGPVYPEPGGMIAWGETPDGYTCCWAPSGPDPDTWAIVLANPEFQGNSLHLNVTFSSFLVEYAVPDGPNTFFVSRDTQPEKDVRFSPA